VKYKKKQLEIQNLYHLNLVAMRRSMTKKINSMKNWHDLLKN